MKKDNKFIKTICIYAICSIIIAAFFINAILSWDSTLKTLKSFINILLPFLSGALIAYILNPFISKINGFLLNMCKLKSVKIRKFLSIVITYLIVFGFISVILVYILPEIIDSLSEVVDIVPSMYNHILTFFDTFQEKYPTLDFEYIDTLLSSMIPNVITYLKDFVANLIPILYTTSMSLISLLYNIIIAIIVSIYVLSDKKALLINTKKLLYAFIPNSWISETVEVLRECHKIFIGFIIGKSIDSLIIGILCFILMSILNLPYTLLISVIVGVTNMIPYFGPFIGAIPGILLLLLISPVKALIFTILILVLQQFDGLVLGPKILGGSTGLKPLWIIVAITIGGSLAGIAGMFFGVPIVAVLSFILNRYLDKRLAKKLPNQTE